MASNFLLSGLIIYKIISAAASADNRSNHNIWTFTITTITSDHKHIGNHGVDCPVTSRPKITWRIYPFIIFWTRPLGDTRAETFIYRFIYGSISLFLSTPHTHTRTQSLTNRHTQTHSLYVYLLIINRLHSQVDLCAGFKCRSLGWRRGR